MAFEPMAPLCDEREIQASDARRLAQARAEGKALSLSRQAQGALVLGADQVLGFRGEALDKVTSREEAKARLSALAGHEHTLETAYVLALGDQVLFSRVEPARMRMRPLAEEVVEAYLDTGEWQGSVGCYQFENRGGQLFEPGAPDMSLIVGLPIAFLARDLRELGIDLLVRPTGPWQVTDEWRDKIR